MSDQTKPPRRRAHETEHERHERWFGRIEHKIDALMKVVKHMAIDQATFDEDLAGLVTAVTNLTTAVDAFVAAHPEIDFSEEDSQIQAASQELAAELEKITPAPAA